MSKQNFVPKIYIEQTEGNLQELSDAVLVGVAKDDKSQMSLSYITTLDIADILKLLGSSTVLISRICASLSNSGAISAQAVKEGIALASMLENLRMTIAERQGDGTFFEETNLKANPPAQEVEEELDFETFMKKLMNGGM